MKGRGAQMNAALPPDQGGRPTRIAGNSGSHEQPRCGCSWKTVQMVAAYGPRRGFYCTPRSSTTKIVAQEVMRQASGTLRQHQPCHVVRR